MSLYVRYPATGAGGGSGSGVIVYANFAAFPVSAPNGTLAVDGSTHILYEYNSTAVAWQPIASNASYLATGTVTSVSVVTANGVSGSVATATTTPAITLTLGAITPSSVAASGTVTGSNLSGTNTGDVTIGTANGLSILGQTLSLQLSDTLNTGALSDTDWNIFNSKEPAIAPGTIADYYRGDKTFQPLVAPAVAYTPTTPANWTSVPTETGGALDYIATKIHSTPTTFTGYDTSGDLAPISGWTFAATNGATAVNVTQNYVVPVDGTPTTVKIFDHEVEWNAANTNTDQQLIAATFDSHVDRSHGGQDVNNVVGIAASTSVEGSGTVNAHTGWSLNQNFQGNAGGTTNNAASVTIAAGTGAGYTLGNYRGLNVNFVADAASTVGDTTGIGIGTTANITGNYIGQNISHNGTVSGSFTSLVLSETGDIGSNAFGINSTFAGNVTGSYGALFMSYTGDASQFTGLQLSHNSGNVTSSEGVRLNLSNGTATSKIGVTAIMGDGVTSNSGRMFDGSWGAGDYDNRIGFHVNGGSGNITTSDTGVQVLQSSGTSDNFHGVNVVGSGTTADWVGTNISTNSIITNSATGLQVAMNGVTGLPATRRPAAISTDGGYWNQNMGTTTVSNHPNTLDMGNTIGVSLQIQSGSPITGTEFAGTNFRNSFQFDDDMAAGPLGLGWAAMIDTPFISGTAGKTVDKANMHAMVPLIAGGTGGTITEFNYIRGFNIVNFAGVTPAIGDAYFLKLDSATGPLSGTATKAHGIYLDDSGLFNYMGGKTRFGGVAYAEPTVAVDITGAIKITDGTQAAGYVLTSDAAGLASWQATGTGPSPYLVNKFTLNGADITNGFVTLTSAPTAPTNTALTPLGGPLQDYGTDFTVTGTTLSWSGLGLDGVLTAGDKLFVQIY